MRLRGSEACSTSSPVDVTTLPPTAKTVFEASASCWKRLQIFNEVFAVLQIVHPTDTVKRSCSIFSSSGACRNVYRPDSPINVVGQNIFRRAILKDKPSHLSRPNNSWRKHNPQAPRIIQGQLYRSCKSAGTQYKMSSATLAIAPVMSLCGTTVHSTAKRKWPKQETALQSDNPHAQRNQEHPADTILLYTLSARVYSPLDQTRFGCRQTKSWRQSIDAIVRAVGQRARNFVFVKVGHGTSYRAAECAEKASTRSHKVNELFTHQGRVCKPRYRGSERDIFIPVHRIRRPSLN